MSYTVSPSSVSTFTLMEHDTVASVLQNLSILLSTRQQSVPLYRDFGLPMHFIDKPAPVAKNLLIAEIYEAVEAYEPRATIVGITFVNDDSDHGRLIPVLEVEISHE